MDGSCVNMSPHTAENVENKGEQTSKVTLKRNECVDGGGRAWKNRAASARAMKVSATNLTSWVKRESRLVDKYGSNLLCPAEISCFCAILDSRGVNSS